MKYKMTLMALGLSAVMFTGCGGGSSNNDSDAPTTSTSNIPTTTAEAQAKILGNWESACQGEGSSYRKSFLSFAETTGNFSEKTYTANDCNDASLDSVQQDNSFSYTVGAAVKGANNEDAFEFDLIGEEYMMVRFDESAMYFSDSHGQETSPSQRANDFSFVNPFTKI